MILSFWSFFYIKHQHQRPLCLYEGLWICCRQEESEKPDIFSLNFKSSSRRRSHQEEKSSGGEIIRRRGQQEEKSGGEERHFCFWVYFLFYFVVLSSCVTSCFTLPPSPALISFTCLVHLVYLVDLSLDQFVVVSHVHPASLLRCIPCDVPTGLDSLPIFRGTSPVQVCFV